VSSATLASDAFMLDELVQSSPFPRMVIEERLETDDGAWLRRAILKNSP
jgi:hypothetical protein